MATNLGAKKPEKDWKEKYYQSLDRLDQQEKLLVSNEQDLLKSIIKLTLSHVGSSPELDSIIKEFRDQLRDCKDRGKRKRLIDQVVDLVIKHTDDDPQQTQQSENPIALLLDSLDLGKQHDKKISQFKQAIQQSESAEQVAKATVDISRFFNHLATEEQQKPASDSVPNRPSDKQDDFAEFLNRLSLPGESGMEIRLLRQRINSIGDDKNRLEIVDAVVESLHSACQDGDKASQQGSHDLELILQLLEWIAIPENCKTEFAAIKQDINEHQQHVKPTQILRRIGDFISSINNNLQSELTEMELYLAKVIARLKEFEAHLMGSMDLQQETLVEAHSFNKQMRQDTERLKQDIDSSQDISEIKKALDSHLEIIDANLDIRLKSEQERQQESQKAIELLAKRVVQIESESEKLQNAIIKERQKAHKDALTGIANRLAYEEKIENEFGRWQRYQQSLSLALIDIDDFKKINDQYGHSAGDKVLRTVAQLCEAKIRKIDFIARYGGEEFVLIFPNTDLDAAKIAAENLRVAVEKCLFHYHKKVVPITVSIGIAEFHEQDTIDEVFERADKALYEAKGSGKNCYKTA